MAARSQRVVHVEAGSVVNFDGCQWRVAGLDALRAYLVPLGKGRIPGSWLLSEVLAAGDFDVLADINGVAAPAPDPGLYADLHTFDTLTPTESDDIARRLDAVLLVREGRLPGSPPDPELEHLSLMQRADVVARRQGVSERTLREWVRRFVERGAMGLVDRRTATASTPQLSIDPRWREAFRIVMDNYHLKSSVTDLRLIELVRERAAELFGDEAPEASDRTLRRHLDVLYPQRTQNKKTAQTQANAPSPSTWWRPLRLTKPGQVVAIDTNKLDVFALDPVTGSWQQLYLLMALDVFSRSIVGWRFTGWTPTSLDVKLLLRAVVTPKVADPRLPEEGLWRYTGVPEHIVAGLLTSDPILDRDPTSGDDHVAVAGVPVLIPDAITLDHGKDYTSREVVDACDLLGITIGYARPYTPTDKAHVERAFRTVNTRFCQALTGYRGPDISARGVSQYVEDAAFYTVDEIEERFAAWVAVEYQNTPHEGLRHPALPAAVLTPNQMIDLSMASTGMVPTLVDRTIHIELLATEWRKVTDGGIRYANLYYDFPGNSFLDDYRNQPAPHNGRNSGAGKPGWRIKIDRRDLSRIWFFDYSTPAKPEPGVGVWREVPLRDLPDAAPFQEHHLAHAKRLLVQSGGDDRDPVAVARRLGRLLADLFAAPSDVLSRAEKRLASLAFAQHVADRARRGATDYDDEYDYYSGPADDDRGEFYSGPADGAVYPDRSDGDTHQMPKTFEVEHTDEWNPFPEPDID